MTIFSDNPHDRRIERFMTAIPNFKPRGVGVRFLESQILITVVYLFLLFCQGESYRFL